MEIHLLKFTASLAILWLFYKLFLENDNRHQFKRFYLLASIFFALIVPFITFTEYIEATTQSVSLSSNLEFTTVIEQNVQPPEVDYLPIILWSVYGIGVLFFGVKFIVNLFRVFNKIRTSEKYFNQSFIYVLIDNLNIPHSFFSYIFLNKDLYKSAQIPKEVLIHEQTHAQQKHSVDILIMELLQIVFWFHPLIYVMKHSIKLNHEFLADEAVIHQGIEASTYQQLLLAFSSNASKHLPTEIGITSSINYSSIKKRFTVMKTQTSKTRIWISTILLLPIIAILFYNFSSTEYVLKESPENIETLQEDKILNVVVNSEDEILINGKIESFENLEKLLSQFPKENYTVNLTKEKLASNNVLSKVMALFTSYNILIDQVSTQDISKEKQSFQRINEGVSQSLMDEYNLWIKEFKQYSVIKVSHYERIVSIYNLMSDKQRSSVEKYPETPQINRTNQKMNKPSTAQFEAWKNKDTYALWLDGTPIKNSEFNNYSIEDIVHFIESKVYRNARSVKYPQPFQTSLYTKEGFAQAYVEAPVKEYNRLADKYSKDILTFLKGSRSDNTELLIQFEQLNRMYDNFAPNLIKEFNILAVPPVPAKFSSKTNFPPPPKPENPPIVKDSTIQDKSNNQKIYLSVSNDGQYSIAKDITSNKFNTISIAEIETLLSGFSKNQIENTFVIASSKDFKLFRSMPSNHEAYQNDIEIILIKTDPSKLDDLPKDSKQTESLFLYELVNDNEFNQLKNYVERLSKVFKKYGIKNITI